MMRAKNQHHGPARSWRSYLGAALLGASLASLVTGFILTIATLSLNRHWGYLDVSVLWIYLQLPLLIAAVFVATGLGSALKWLDSYRGASTTAGSSLIFVLSMAAASGAVFLLFSTVQALWFYPDRFPLVTRWGEMLAIVLLFQAGIAVAGLIVFFLTRRCLLLIGDLLEWTTRRPITIIAITVGLGHLCLLVAVLAFPRYTRDSSAPADVPARVDNDRRVVLFGLDGATFRVMDSLLAQGELPNFQSLIDRGAHGPLETLAPNNSPALWTTIATGVRREKHRVMNFMIQHPRGMSKPVLTFPSHIGLNTFLLMRDGYGESLVTTYPVTGASRRAAAVWDIASAYDLNVLVVNWWPSWPAQPVNGVMISDRLGDYFGAKHRAKAGWSQAERAAVARGLTSPPEILDEIESWVEASEINAIGYSEWMQIGLRFFNTIEPDLFLLYFKNGPDDAQHNTWDAYEPALYRNVPDDYLARHKNDIPDMYREMDRLLGELLARVGEETTVIVVSDHGGSPFFALSPWSRWKGGHEHCPPGIFIAAGPGIRQKVTMVRGSILDVAPTVLALLGLPSSRQMEGDVLGDVLDDRVIVRPASYVENWDYLVPESDSAPMTELSREEEERLRALGYVR